MTEEEAKELERIVANTIALYEKETRHAATATRVMIENLGVVEALSRLMIHADLQKGFRVLRDKNLLERTFETIVVQNKQFFTSEIVECAQWRLDNPRHPQ